MKLLDVTHTYPDGTPALEHVDLEAAAGQVTCLVGVHEAGKSTLLRIAAGNTAPTSGTVDLGGPVGWLVPTVAVADPPEPGDFARLYPVDDWCTRPGAVVLADAPETAVMDPGIRDGYAGALVEAAARGAAVLISSHDDEVAATADVVHLVEAGQLTPDVDLDDYRHAVTGAPTFARLWTDRRDLHPAILADGPALLVCDPTLGGTYGLALAAVRLEDHGQAVQWVVIDAATHSRMTTIVDRRLDRAFGPRTTRRARLLEAHSAAGNPYLPFDPAAEPGIGAGSSPEPVTCLWTTYADGSPGMLDPDECARITDGGLELVEPDDRPHRADHLFDQAALRDLVGPATLQHLAVVLQAANRSWWQLDLDGLVLDLLRYRPGDSHPPHPDMFPGSATRKLSATVQLTPPDTYNGGRLSILDPTDGGWQDTPDDLGTVTVFPAWLRHRVDEVTAGERWALIAWGYGPPLR